MQAATEGQLVLALFGENIHDIWCKVVYGAQYGTMNTPSHKIKYSNYGTKASGEFTTSLGNSFLSYSLFNYILIERLKYRDDFVTIHEGDDVLLFCNEPIPDNFC